MAKKKEVIEEVVIAEEVLTEETTVAVEEVIESALEPVVEEVAVDALESALAKIKSGEPSSNLSVLEQIALKKHEDGIGEA